MPDFYIKRISLTGKNVEEAIVDFDKGLNIIYGPSNTGKSYIAECINYMFGSKTKSFHIDKDTGYDCVTMLIITGAEKIILERKFDDNNISVKSSHPHIKSGKYSTTKGKTHINKLWLQLMGIDNPPEIIKNEKFERQALTIRTFLHTFFIEEDNVIKNESIVFNRYGFSRTAILSTLLYFITGNSFEDFDFREEKTVKEAKKMAVINYINDNLSGLANRKNELYKSQAPNVDVVQQRINDIVNEIDSTEGELSAAIERSKTLSKEIYEVNNQLAECNMLHNRYQILRDQYVSDINRLTFIVEGEFHKEGLAETHRCPFCDSTLQTPKVESCSEAAGVELQKILSQLNDLADAEKDIVAEKEGLYERSDTLKRERSMVEEVINSELKPKIQNLRQSLGEYRRSIEVYNEARVISRFEHNMIEDLNEFENEDESDVKFKPKEYFNSQIMKTINMILDRILDTCNFDNYSSSYFSKDTFDVVVNGKNKAKYGKGYRAFLNTVVALTFMEYLTKHGVYSPGMLIVDSPILSLKEKGSEQASDSMKKSLFRYFLNNQDNGQMIIIENEIPELDYGKANLIHFTKDTEVGRYGLLHGVTE